MKAWGIDEKGFALVTALVVMLLLITLGTVAMTLSQLGSLTVASEKKFLMASLAAEYAINDAVSSVVTNSACPGQTTSCSSLSSGATCAYFSIADNSNANCFITAVGQKGNASVTKVVVVPRSVGGTLGALDAKSITSLTINGANAAISDGACPSSPAVVYQSCPGNCSDGRIVGGATQATVGDQTSNLFNASNWNNLITKNIAQAATLSATVPAACQVYSSDLSAVQNTSCTVTGDIVCQGGINKTIPNNTCNKVLITAGQFTMTTVPGSASSNGTCPDFFLYAGGTSGFGGTVQINLNGNQNAVNGYFATGMGGNTSLQLQGANEVFNGIIATSRMDNLNLGGNTTINGLVYVANYAADGTLTTETPNVQLNGTDRVNGALAFNGNVAITRTGGGNASPNFYYDPAQINSWNTKYPGLVNSQSCSSSGRSSSVNATKMTVY